MNNAMLLFVVIFLIFAGCENNEDEKVVEEINFSNENSAQVAKDDIIVEGTFNSIERDYLSV
jgi:hypothetical protein